MMTTQIETPKTREALFKSLYLEAFPAVARYVGKTGGNLEEARDAFQEALVVYYEKVVVGQYQTSVSDKAYLLGITKNIWLKRRTNAIKNKSIEHLNLHDSKEEKPIANKLLLFLQRAGKKCMNLLQAFYYEKASMSELSERFEFSNERSATVQKYKCLEKVRNQIKQKSLTYGDFLDGGSSN